MNKFLRLVEVGSKEIAPHSRQMVELFTKSVPKAEVFVFEPNNGEPKELLEGDSGEYAELSSAPFPVFSIEFSGDYYITVPSADQPLKVFIDCVLCVEVEPCKFIFFTYNLVESIYGTGTMMECVTVTGYMGHIIKEIIGRLNSDYSGVEKVKQRVKVGTGKNKTIYKLRRIVHIAPKKLTSRVRTLNGDPIDWTHRWSVRGHWVKINPDSVGKDRSGARVVSGFTWRSAHVKGIEKAPFANKIRVVTNKLSTGGGEKC